MAENTTKDKQFSIQKIFTKDISFESPHSPKVFTEKWDPAVDFNLGIQNQALEDNLFEVSLSVTVTVKCNDKTAYLVEVNQAGIFSISAFSEMEKAPMLGSFCPNILFPYAREVVSDLVAKGGFPQLMLAPINFDTLYMQNPQSTQQQVPGSNTVN
ncbi:MAG: protein-export chaperone SecB [Methylococcales symbiont of Iophon sp. n. MRB-2018]|nr:MAG: protein-export chaperone SecB [Methylococcales symbiont of Iophon sp. n. MRB-2018]KAF3980137.1 MAG: protein-export chaperone SecB [Methylococcales symbiont of Iophon sp. n. MRB-2018]